MVKYIYILKPEYDSQWKCNNYISLGRSNIEYIHSTIEKANYFLYERVEMLLYINCDNDE